VLRGAELWPARIEWYGAPDSRGKMPLLVEMEYRNPVFNESLSEEQAQGLFRFEPGNAEVIDETAKVMANLHSTAEAFRGGQPTLPRK
jgi:hypothetical protein